jgi:carbon monoxide dehydrogenase subunit G
MPVNFKLDFHLPQPYEQVYGILQDIRAFGKLHPLIVEVKHLQDNQYLIIEKTSLLGFEYRFKYKAQVFDNQADTIVYKASPAILSLEITFELIKLENGTQLIEKVEIKGMNFFAQILKKLLIKSHQQLFENLIKQGF